MELNEVVAIPSNQNITEKSNLHINKLVFLLPLVLLVSNSSLGFTRKKSNTLDLKSDFIASIDIKSLNEKLDIFRKLGPYMPETIVGPMNSIIYFVDKGTKIVDLLELISSNRSYTPIAALDNLTNRDRINGILTTIKDEVTDERINNIKPVIDVVLNFDRYKSLINAISSLGNISSKPNVIANTLPKAEIPVQSNEKKINQVEDMVNLMKPLLGNDEKKANQLDNMINAIKPILRNDENKSNQIENMVNAIKPVLGNNENISTEKIGDMLKMFELLSALNSKGNK